MALWFLLRGVSSESCLALCSRVLSVLFSIVIISLGEEGAGLCVFVHLFANCAHFKFSPFSLPLVVRDCMRLVIVALPGLF